MESTLYSSSGSFFALTCFPPSSSSSPAPAAAAAEAETARFLALDFLVEELPTFPVRLATLVGVLGPLVTGPSPEFLLPPPFNCEQIRE
jgi:hypothetical protein